MRRRDAATTDCRLRCGLRRNTEEKENGGTEGCMWLLKVRRRGRRDAEDAEDAEACVVGSVITLPLVVALVIALSFEAIRQLPSASVYDHKKAKTRDLCMWRLKVRRWNAATQRTRLDAKEGEKTTQLYLNSSFFIYYNVSEGSRRQSLAHCHLEPQQHRAAEPPSSSLSNFQTIKLTNCQTINY